ncbi:hypothetical protein N7475_010078 [Penicillium sp. IBT 31633x]|nr:hypothetical protein N7475_010078 [Penicillium sp. IBT 31633x]
MWITWRAKLICIIQRWSFEESPTSATSLESSLISSNEDRESQRRQPGTLRTVYAGHLRHSIYHRHLEPYTSLDRTSLHWHTSNLVGPCTSICTASEMQLIELDSEELGGSVPEVIKRGTCKVL